MEERDDEGPGVPDMTMMPQITEHAINENLKRRYKHDLVYVSFVTWLCAVWRYAFALWVMMRRKEKSFLVKFGFVGQ